MATFNSDGVPIAYLDEGQGPPVLLIHGFASNRQINWVDPGWVRHLTREGLRVIAMDCRGHGESGKLYRPEFTWWFRDDWTGGSPIGPISTSWGIEGFPTTYLIDHQGKIVREVRLGPELDKLIEEKVKQAEAKAGR